MNEVEKEYARTRVSTHSDKKTQDIMYNVLGQTLQ